MNQFDRLIAARVGEHYVTYTRYADDMTFSARRTGYLLSVDNVLRKTIAEVSLPTLRLNHEKTVTATKKYRREVTGLILTNDNKVSIGRGRKRELRARIHHFKLGKLNIVVEKIFHIKWCKTFKFQFTFRTRRNNVFHGF